MVVVPRFAMIGMEDCRRATYQHRSGDQSLQVRRRLQQRHEPRIPAGYFLLFLSHGKRLSDQIITLGVIGSDAAGCMAVTFGRTSRRVGLDLSQILVELITNSDAAIASAGRDVGRIELFIGPPGSEQRKRWRRESRVLGLPVPRSWRTEVRCADYGIGINAEQVDARFEGSLDSSTSS